MARISYSPPPGPPDDPFQLLTRRPKDMWICEHCGQRMTGHNSGTGAIDAPLPWCRNCAGRRADAEMRRLGLIVTGIAVALLAAMIPPFVTNSVHAGYFNVGLALLTLCLLRLVLVPPLLSWVVPALLDFTMPLADRFGLYWRWRRAEDWASGEFQVRPSPTRVLWAVTVVFSVCFALAVIVCRRRRKATTVTAAMSSPWRSARRSSARLLARTR